MTSYTMRLRALIAATVLCALAGCSKVDLSACQDLYTVEFTPGHETGDEQRIVRYRFCEGELESVDTILTTPTGGLRFDIFRNTIYADRYLVDGRADVVDLATGEVLSNPERSDLLGVEGTRVIWQQNRKLSPNDMTAYLWEQDIKWFDLTDHTSGEFSPPSKWYLRGELSPDSTMSVNAWDNGMLHIYHLDGTVDSLCPDCTASVSLAASSWPEPPVLWLDNERILTHHGNGHLVILYLSDGHTEPLLDVDVPDDLIVNPKLSRDVLGRITYQNYVIDVENRTATPMTAIPLGHDFEIEYGWGLSDSTKVTYNGELISTFFGGGGKATDGYVCVDACEVSRFKTRRPFGISIWCTETRKWTTLDIPWLAGVIGWANPVDIEDL